MITVEERRAVRKRVPGAVRERMVRAACAEREQRRVVRDATERKDGAARGSIARSATR